MKQSAPLFMGIDVGTGSARAGVFDARGTMLGAHVQAIRMWKPAADFVEQSSNDIWKACCIASRGALKKAGVRGDRVQGVGFDATCSLVALDGQGRPVTVSPTGRDEQNVIVWMDHRAIAIADEINRTRHPVLQYVGGVISPEMESPKLAWLKRNLPKTWKRAAMFFDLPDFLTWCATADETRSLCTTVCKWTYLGHASPRGRGARPDGGRESVGAWDDSYWRKIGLGDLVMDGYARIGRRIRPMGEALGGGLTARAAQELGLQTGTAVGVAIIDAHAGGLGLIGAALHGKKPTAAAMERRVALIGGTSSCHMAVSRKPHFVPGVWGPYASAMVPGLWLTEGGQSATGALIDHVIFSHARGAELAAAAKKQGTSVYALLNARLAALAKARGNRIEATLTRHLHMQPDFHGNRSPRADPTLTGMIAGLKLANTADELALLYLATVQAVAHGTKHIIDRMNGRGFQIDTIFACGGGTKNPVFLREHADITGCKIVLPKEPEAVLLGSAVLGAVAGGRYPSVLAAMAAMNHAGRIIVPAGGAVARYHNAKHRVFHRLYQDQMAYRKLMG